MSASVRDPATLAAVARSMYAAGKTAPEVFVEVYGVALPREAILFQRDYVEGDKPLRAVWRSLPWELLKPIDTFELSEREADEDARLFALAPSIIWLGNMTFADLPLGFSMFGYDLDELAAGRSTMIARPSKEELAGFDGHLIAIAPSMFEMFYKMTHLYRASFDGLTSTLALEERSSADQELMHLERLRSELST